MEKPSWLKISLVYSLISAPSLLGVCRSKKFLPLSYPVLTGTPGGGVGE